MPITSLVLPVKKISSPNFFRAMLLALCAWFAGAVVYITFSRAAYPFDLEWMEGGSLVQILRLLEGKALYVAPSLEYIPYIYPPLYTYLSALLAKVINISWFLPLRLVSLAASAGIGVLIYAITRRQTQSAFWGLIAAGFFAAIFQIGGAWFDIARVDMLFICLLLAATGLLEKEDWLSSLLAGLVFTCAFLTKQTAIFVFAGLLVYVFIFRNRRAAILTGLTFLVSAGGWIWFENVRSAGWFWYYIFSLPGLHNLPSPGPAYIGQPLIIILPVCIACAVGCARFVCAPLAVLKDKGGLWPVFAGVMLLTSILASLNPGSYNNNYLPFYAALAILFGTNLPWLLERQSGPRRVFRQALLYSLCIAQFLALLYNPLAQIPSSADLQAGLALVQRLRAVDGEVLMPNHNALPILAGKKPYAHLIALQEIRGNFGRQEPQGWSLLSAEISAALSAQKFSAILLDQPNSIWAQVDQTYIGTPILYSSEEVFWPVTGGRTRPRTMYTRGQSQP